MSTSLFPRVLSLREKRRPNTKAKSHVPVDFHGLFTLPDGSKKVSKDEEKKVHELSQQLTALGHSTAVPDARLEYVVRHAAADDTKDAFRLLMLFEDSVAGVLKPFDPKVTLLGAENREKTTCYLDSILFAMFVKVDVFESLLFNHFEEEPRRRLVTILRLWVNMLRSGRLITTDITQHLQKCLSDCGWTDAAKIRQQDASEAFGFITDQLELPLVTLKTDIYHSGKEADTDDHKFITERLLEVGIPDDVQQGQSVKLETCLEEYFNNRVEVKRELQRRNTLQTRSSIDKTNFVHVEVVESPTQGDFTPTDEEPLKPTSPRRPGFPRERGQSIFNEKNVETAEEANIDEKLVHSRPISHQRTKSTRKEVLMPAWQFLNLIPWYTDNSADKDFQVAAHFSEKRPMLGICLKRYFVSKSGTASRLNTHIDIPLEMAAPQFVTQEDFDYEHNETTGQFKLTLQSVICHRGISLNSGHYIALVRIGSPPVDEHASFGDIQGTQAHDLGHDIWVRFDDLAPKRITTIDIATALKDESPYLLFYRVDPIGDDMPLGNPPPYSESTDALAPVDQKLSLLAVDDTRNQRRSIESEGRSTRPSLEVNDGADPRPRTSISMSSDRVQSVALTVSSVTPSILSDMDSSGDIRDRRNSQHLPSQSHSVAQSLKGSQGATEPTAPVEDSTPTPNPVNRRESIARTGRPRRTSVDVEKRSSMSLSRITSRLGLDKANRNTAVAVNEVGKEEASTNAPKEKEKTTVTSIQIKSIKDKKGKSKAMTRRKSTSGSNHKPDRECSVM